MVITEMERKYLLDKMMDLLDEYDYRYETSALDTIIDTWAENKGVLIDAFKKHPNYIEGKFMIAFDSDFDREINIGASVNFSMYLSGVIRERKDDIPQEMIDARERECCAYLPDVLYNFLCNIERYACRTVNEELVEVLERNCPDAHIHAGMKMSRAVNKICTYLGYNKDENYNREFAKYADSLSPLKIKRHTVLSINPIDYLTMSFGNSWASCHTIDTTNKRSMPNAYQGMYSSGTMSYMLDSPSMVFYTIDSEYNGNEYFTQPKIHRQMFHYGEDKLIQGRLYPQDNDYGGIEFYKEYRNIVQKILSECFDFPNLWKVRKGTSTISDYTCSRGTHYRDYLNFENCTISTITDKENGNIITIGHNPICIECGREHRREDNINCCHNNGGVECYECGCLIDEDDAIWIDGEPYCSDCVTHCECCDSYFINNVEGTYIESERRYVCASCRDNYYTFCSECDEYYPSEDAVYIDGTGEYVCIDCFNNYYDECEHCGELFRDTQLHEHNGKYYCINCLETIIEEENEEEAC